MQLRQRTFTVYVSFFEKNPILYFYLLFGGGVFFPKRPPFSTWIVPFIHLVVFHDCIEIIDISIIILPQEDPLYFSFCFSHILIYSGGAFGALSFWAHFECREIIANFREFREGHIKRQIRIYESIIPFLLFDYPHNKCFLFHILYLEWGDDLGELLRYWRHFGQLLGCFAFGFHS